MVEQHSSGCICCGEELKYGAEEQSVRCSLCGSEQVSSVVCTGGHFVCDNCHTSDSLAAIEQLCISSKEVDLLELLRKVRKHPAIKMHGPEHHAAVPAIILAAYRNQGNEVPDDGFRTVIRRGAMVPGGHCGFAGCCGAAVGVGVAFAHILGSTPVKAQQRQLSLSITAEVLSELASVEAARCCQRDSWLALRVAARVSRWVLPRPLFAEALWKCEQFKKNQQCANRRCELHPDYKSV